MRDPWYGFTAHLIRREDSMVDKNTIGEIESYAGRSRYFTYVGWGVDISVERAHD